MIALGRGLTAEEIVSIEDWIEKEKELIEGSTEKEKELIKDWTEKEKGSIEGWTGGGRDLTNGIIIDTDNGIG